MSHRHFSEDFLLLFCEKNSDGTKHLRLKGKELYQRIGKRVQNNDMKDISSFLRNHPEITSVDFSYNSLGDEGLRVLSNDYFEFENNMVSLNLMHCDITARGMKYFSSSSFLRLKVFRINGNKLGFLGAQYIGRFIHNCPTLEMIDVAETDQTLESIESLLIVIEQSTLKSIDISRIIPKSYYTSYNVATLAEDLSIVMKLNQYLKEIHMQKCQFDSHDVQILVSGLATNKQIEFLDLGCNNIGDFGVQIIANWLKTRPPLRALNVSANKIGPYGARALCFGLPFSKVRYLDITNNKITDWGLKDLLDSMRKFCQMRMLFVWGNLIGPLACKRMKRMLASGVLQQEYIDVKIYTVDGELYAAYYPTNHYKHRYYCVMDYGWPPELKIQRNQVYPPNALPRELLNFAHIGRYPPVDETLGLYVKKVKKCPPEEGDDGEKKYVVVDC